MTTEKYFSKMDYVAYVGSEVFESPNRLWVESFLGHKLGEFELVKENLACSDVSYRVYSQGRVAGRFVVKFS